MLFVFGQPLVVFAAGFAPAVIARVAAQPDVPWHHAAGGGLSQPERDLLVTARGVAPRAGITGHDVRHRLPAHRGIRDPPLLGAVPDRGIASAPLMIRRDP